MTRKIVLYATIIVCGMLFSTQPLFADMKVTPTRVELRIPEGSEEEGEWRVSNISDEPIRVNVDIEDWMRGIKIDSPGYWLEIEPKEFTLGPNETKGVRGKVKVPKGLDGEAMAMVFFTSSSVEGPPSMVRPRIGTALYVINKGTEKISAEIEDVKISKHTDGIKLDIKIMNNGNVHIRPEGEVTIKKGKRRSLKNISMPPGWPVLRGKEHTYPVVIKDERLKRGKFKAVVKVKFGQLYEKEEMLSKEIDFTIDKKGEIKIE